MAKDMAARVLMRLKERRIALNLTQEEFASKAKMVYKHYQAIEAGRKNDLRLSSMEKLAKAAGLELWELFKFDAEPKPTNVRIRHPRRKTAV